MPEVDELLTKALPADSEPDADPDDPCIADHMKKLTADGMSDADARKKAESLCADAESEMPAKALKTVEDSIVRRVVDAIKGIGRKDDSETTGFKVLNNHWLAVYSNNFKDRDGQFFPQREIDNYIARVDMGIVPKPELQVWHAGKATAIGSADWVARHGHFTLAAGQFYGSDPAQTAKAYYAKNAKDTGISHGFTYPAKDFDGKSFRGFNTFEISLLPRGAEANWYTSLEGVKAMALDEKKLAYLKEVFTEEHAARILADWDKRGKALEELNVEFKDFVATDSESAANATAHKEAVDLANKSLVELFPDLMEGSAESLTAAVEAVKAVKAQNGVIEALKADNAALHATLQTIQAELALKPRAASTDPATALDSSNPLSASLIKSIETQMTERDPFWGTTVTRTP